MVKGKSVEIAVNGYLMKHQAGPQDVTTKEIAEPIRISPKKIQNDDIKVLDSKLTPRPQPPTITIISQQPGTLTSFEV